MTPPLAGLSVVELATDIAGPYAGKLLAKVTWAKQPWLATLRPNVFRPAEAKAGAVAQVERPAVSATPGQAASPRRTDRATKPRREPSWPTGSRPLGR